MVALPHWLNALLLVLASAAGLLESRRLAPRARELGLYQIGPHARYLYGLAFLFFTFLAAIFVGNWFPSQLWHLPLWLEYWLVAIAWGAILSMFAFLFSLIAALAFRIGHRDRFKLPVAGLLLVTAVELAQFQYTRPVAPLLRSIITSDGVVLQSHEASCAAASAANIARRLGVEVDEREMARRLGTTTLGGTSSAQVVHGMRGLGFSCERLELDLSGLAGRVPPLMLFVDHPAIGPESHAVAWFGLHQGKHEIWDPLTGRRFRDPAQLRAIWHGRGVGCRRPVLPVEIRVLR
jgi:hypothetical protein